MTNTIATTRFDCLTADGRRFSAELIIGRAIEVSIENGDKDSELLVSFMPLFSERRIRGVDSFQAVCLAIQLVRDSLRAFCAHGGFVFYPGSGTPIDLDSPWFAPINEPIDSEYLQAGQSKPSS